MKLGYKQTEVGVIPKEWDVVTLESVANIIDPQPDHRTPPEASGGEPYIGISDFLDQSTVNWDTSRKIISKAVDKQQSSFRIRSGDIIFGKIGTIGLPKYAPVTPFRYALSANVLLVQPIIEPHFVMSWLRSNTCEKAVVGELHSTSQAAFGINKMRRLVIPVPPVPEQRAIATVLSDVDALLGALERLIVKKRDLKQAAMQQLLTGQIRLPGFQGEWEVIRLGSLGRFIKGTGVKKDEATAGDLPCVRYGEIYTHHHDVVRTFYSRITASVAAKATLLRTGDILFAGSGETKKEIGKAVAFVHECEAFAGGDIVILRPAAADAKFLGYILNSAPIQKQKASRGQGDAVVHISASSLAAIELRMPPLPEQTVIAAVLSDMDAELDALEQRLVKTRALKQGMMQELLTGRSRLL